MTSLPSTAFLEDLPSSVRYPYKQTVEVLLQKGEDPHRLFRGRSPLILANMMAERDEACYSGIQRLYLSSIVDRPPAMPFPVDHPTKSGHRGLDSGWEPASPNKEAGVMALTEANLTQLARPKTSGRTRTRRHARGV